MNTKAARTSQIAMQMMQGNPSRSPLVAEVMRMLDAESVSSVVSILNSHDGKAKAIHADRDLSDEGKRSRVKGSADSHLANIGSLAKKVAALEAQHKKAQAEAVPLSRPTDPWEIACDFEIARLVREKGLKPHEVTMHGAGEINQRVREAIARMPAALSGLTEERQALIRGSLIDPSLAVQLSEEAQALGSARRVVQHAINDLGADANWSPREWVESFGQSWSLPGVAQSQADRIAAGGPEKILGDVTST